MSAWNVAIAAFVLIAGSTGSAQAQDTKSTQGQATGAYPLAPVTGGVTAYYAMTPNYANFGLSGTYPSQGGFGYSGYGPGPQFGAHFASASEAKRPGASTKPVVPMKGVPKAKPKAKPSPFGNGTTNSQPLLRKGL